MRRRIPLLCLAFAALLSSMRVHAVDCRALIKGHLPGASVNSAALVPAGLFEIPTRSPTPAEHILLPTFCRVEGTAVTMIGFELWMPAQHWNGRLLSLGNGGFGGTIGLLPLAEYLRKGYAVTANDTGHVGSGTA